MILVLRYERLKFGNFGNCQKRNNIKILLSINNYIEQRVKCANFQGHVNHWFSEISNRHYTYEYFFHYSHDLNPKKLIIIL